MSNIKTNIKITLTFVGTLVGAGFASGKEISLFFGDRSLLSPVLSGILCGVFAFVFIELGRLTKGDIYSTLFGKNQKTAKFIISGINFIIFAAMLAAAEVAIKDLFRISGGGLLTGLFALTIISLGIDKLKTFTAITVPITILLIITIFAIEPSFDIYGKPDIMSPVLYSCFNVLTGGFLISKFTANINEKQSMQISATIAIAMVALTTVIYFLVKENASASMPVLDIAKRYGIDKIASVIIYMAILTTMTGTLSVASQGQKRTALIILIFGYAAAFIGFDLIVNTVYPILGILGILLCGYSIIRLFMLKSAKLSLNKEKLLKN